TAQNQARRTRERFTALLSDDCPPARRRWSRPWTGAPFSVIRGRPRVGGYPACKNPVRTEEGTVVSTHETGGAAQGLRRYSERRRILVTGGAGFLGSHLIDRLLERGNEVVCADNLFTGTKRNIEHLLAHPRFEFLRHDVTLPLY